MLIATFAYTSPNAVSEPESISRVCFGSIEVCQIQSRGAASANQVRTKSNKPISRHRVAHFKVSKWVSQWSSGHTLNNPNFLPDIWRDNVSKGFNTVFSEVL